MRGKSVRRSIRLIEAHEEGTDRRSAGRDRGCDALGSRPEWPDVEQYFEYFLPLLNTGTRRGITAREESLCTKRNPRPDVLDVLSSCRGNEDRSFDGTGVTATRSFLPPPSRISFAAWALDSPSPSSGRFPSHYFPLSSPSSATTRKSTISIVSASPDSSTKPSSLRRTSSSSRLVHQSFGAVTETRVQ